MSPIAPSANEHVMTRTDHVLAPQVQLPCRLDRPIELRWRCSAVACAAALGRDASKIHHHDIATVRIVIEPQEGDVARVVADLEHRGRAVSIIPAQVVSCRWTADGDTMSLDAGREARRFLSMTIRRDGSLLYARSDLLGEIGLGGGTYDPPALAPSTRFAIAQT